MEGDTLYSRFLACVEVYVDAFTGVCERDRARSSLVGSVAICT